MIKSILSKLFLLSAILVLSACHSTKQSTTSSPKPKTTSTSAAQSSGTKAKTFVKPVNIDRMEFVDYAKTFIGTPYKYGSINPKQGLDCSGFIYNVFSHFNVKCPRSSVDYTNEGQTISLKQAQPGDLILFTGSNHSSGIVGHMGIVTENKNGKLMFIHSASGKNIGVIINEFKGYYKDHFVKVIKVLK